MNINGGMIQTLNSTQYNPQKPVFHSYTLSLKSALALSLTVALTTLLCTLTSCTHTALFMHSLISLSLSTFYRRNGSIYIMVEKERVVDSGEGG